MSFNQPTPPTQSAVPRSPTPVFFQVMNWILNPLGYLHRNVQRYGGLFRAHFGFIGEGAGGNVLVSDPEALQTILSRDTRELSAPGEINRIMEPLLGKHSMITQSGHTHRQRRQMVMPPFHGERLKHYADLIVQITQAAIADWPVGATINMRAEMQKITMRVILQAVFGIYGGDRYQRLEQALAERLNMVASPINAFFIFFPRLLDVLGKFGPKARLNELIAEIDELIYAEIRERRQQTDLGDRTDVLSLLLQATDEDGNRLSDEELHDELMTLLVAGHETTATSLAWALDWVTRYPEVRQTLLDELAELGDRPDPLAMTKLPYLTAVCNETLRIYPVGMLTFPRRVEQAIDIAGYHFEPGEIFLGCIYLLHQREDLYPNPTQFNPDRFLERQFSAYEFMPFGAGARRCVGYALAMYELKLVLATVLQTWQLGLTRPDPVTPERRGLTLGPKGGVELRIEGTMPHPPGQSPTPSSPATESLVSTT